MPQRLQIIRAMFTKPCSAFPGSTIAGHAAALVDGEPVSQSPREVDGYFSYAQALPVCWYSSTGIGSAPLRMRAV